MIVKGQNCEGEVLRDFYVVHPRHELLIDPAEGMTRQEFKDECDINVLMATYERTGVISHVNAGSPQYLDVSDVPDLGHSLAIIEAAEKAFMTLPAKVRAEFDHNAVAFVDFAADPANLDRMREWGLAPPAAVVGEPPAPDAQ